MNPWIRKSIELANSDNYLDRLYEVYPVEISEERTIPSAVENTIRTAYENGDAQRLIRVLLTLEKFPIDHPFVSVLRRNPEMIPRNPKTVDRIANVLLKMSIDELIARCKEPKKANRKIGPMFRNWLSRLGYPILPKQEFDAVTSGTTLLQGSEEDLRVYANSSLNCGLGTGVDLLAKIDGNYVIGEAKYIGAFGGKQDDSFQEAIDFIHSTQGDATRIAILDTVMWTPGNNKVQRKIRRVEAIAMSALLLKNYLESVRS